jgi:hypothetical protein
MAAIIVSQRRYEILPEYSTYIFFCGEGAPQLMLRTHRSLKASTYILIPVNCERNVYESTCTKMVTARIFYLHLTDLKQTEFQLDNN